VNNTEIVWKLKNSIRW